MKKEKIMKEQAPIEVTIYTTEDGREFNNLHEAKQWEKELENRKRLKYMKEKYKLTKINPEIIDSDVSSVLVEAVYIKEITEDVINDFNSYYPYTLYNKKILNKLKIGWNLISQEESSSSGIGRWSGYYFFIYYPEDIIKEKENQILELKKYINN